MDYTALSLDQLRDILGDELVHAADAYDRDPTPEHRALYHAALVRRCANMAAHAVLGVVERLDALEAARDGRS